MVSSKRPEKPATLFLKSKQGAYLRPVYIQNMACVVTNEDMCSFGYLSVVHHRMRQTSLIALNERLKQTKSFVHNLIANTRVFA